MRPALSFEVFERACVHDRLAGRFSIPNLVSPRNQQLSVGYVHEVEPGLAPGGRPSEWLSRRLLDVGEVLVENGGKHRGPPMAPGLCLRNANHDLQHTAREPRGGAGG